MKNVFKAIAEFFGFKNELPKACKTNFKEVTPSPLDKQVAAENYVAKSEVVAPDEVKLENVKPTNRKRKYNRKKKNNAV